MSDDEQGAGGEAELPELRIDSLAAGGDGVGRLADGRVVFVPLTAPGDRVRIRIVESKRRFARAELVAVLESSVDRVEAPCPHFEQCGGCAWQHVAYTAQIAAKAAIIGEALRRIGRLPLAQPVEVRVSPRQYGYRGRARLLSANGRVGYRRRRSHELEEVSSCPILSPELDARLSRFAAESRVSAKGETELEFVLGDAGETRVGRALGRHNDARPTLHIRVGDESLRISPGVFVQANVALRAPLLHAVLEASTRDLEPGLPALELYAGAGFFTLSLARHFTPLVAIESSRAASRDLAHNLRSAGLGGVSVFAEPVERALDRAAVQEPKVIVLDPPRTGVPRAVACAIAALGADRIVYLSCDPATLARDLAVVREIEPDYRLVSAVGFDLFPQTPHVEALVVLERGSVRRSSATG